LIGVKGHLQGLAATGTGGGRLEAFPEGGGSQNQEQIISLAHRKTAKGFRGCLGSGSREQQLSASGRRQQGASLPDREKFIGGEGMHGSVKPMGR
jgi:hypothetical protein